VHIEDLLRHLLTAPPAPAPIEDIPAWWARHHEVTRAAELPVHRAILAGFSSDRPAYAFASGYQEALCQLLGGVMPGVGTSKLSLCATEAGGNHPRAIQTRLEPDGDAHVLTGKKTYASLASHANGFIVIASAGQDAQGRSRLVAVRVPADRDGVRVEEFSGNALPIVPEIPHAHLHFDRVRIAPDERLPGDGYEDYLKPFRTVEDCHVYAALLAWVLQVGRRSAWPDALIEGFALGLVAVSAIGMADPGSPATHVALAGLIAQSERLLRDADEHWARVDEETRGRWQRDRMLLQIAGKARARRREVAWERLRDPGAAASD
jgi:acyl-CoA dehydrogenase